MPRLLEGVLPIMAYTGRLRPKGVRDFTLSSIRKGKVICHLGLLKGPKGLTDNFYGFIKSRKRLFFVIDSHLNDRHLQQSKEMQSSKQSM